MSGLRFVEKLASAPWLCDQEHVEFLHSLFLTYMERVADGRPLDRQAVEQTLGRPLDNTRAVTVQNGVAKIPVVGTIVRRANLFTDISGGVSTEAIAKDFSTAYNDNTVHSILFVFDSPGGEATGINELAGAIREKRDLGEKRIEAYCDGDCASGAYWLASATSFITADATSAVGSIGVVSRVANPETAGKKRTLEFWNTRSPKKRIDPTSYEGQSAIQGYIDDMGDEFIGAVAENRGVSFEEVERDFGQGFVMTGRRAVEVGLVDALGSEEGVLARLQEERASPARLRPVAADQPLTLRTTTAFTHDPEETAPEMSENGTQTATNGAAGTDTPNPEEGRAEGFFAHMRAFFAGDGPEGGAVAEQDGDEATRNEPETREDMAETTQTERMTADEEALRRRVEELEGQVNALSSEKEEAAQKLVEQRVDNELAGYAQAGAPTYLTALARPDLLVENESEETKARADRWREALTAHEGTVEHGERGAADAKATADLSDDEKIKATLKERDLDMSHYGTVASELTAKGEIRKEA